MPLFGLTVHKANLSKWNTPQRLWVSEIALCATGTASRFVSKWLAQHPNQKENWEVFKTAFLEKFSMKDSNAVIITELQTFKMTGTIEEYIAAYKDLHDRAPNTINFDEPRPCLGFYNGLSTCCECRHSPCFDFAFNVLF
ncbi:hypothetical protein DSO57_1017072 [Entomophthora muscae]|uniref:Uncharacterized protein n=1 Tax=Entomophthora muscae TaxID=34485 RepID=A0ACC2STU3_9FUNG|nr:hypothetical protein DSO57_1017072 [Entomophthora muscae]